MKTLWALVALAAISAATLSLAIAFAPVAHACSLADEFVVEADDLAEDGALVAGYRQFRNDATLPEPQVTGAYLIETVRVVEAEDAWTRGSVSAVTTVWGVAPAAMGPWIHETANLDDVTQDSCGDPSDGPELGTHVYWLITDQGTFEVDGESLAASAALTSFLGSPALADRDDTAEDRLFTDLRAARGGSARGVALAFGGIVIVGGILSYLYRNRRVHATWEQVMAERDVEQHAADRRQARADAAKELTASNVAKDT